MQLLPDGMHVKEGKCFAKPFQELNTLERDVGEITDLKGTFFLMKEIYQFRFGLNTATMLSGLSSK